MRLQMRWLRSVMILAGVLMTAIPALGQVDETLLVPIRWCALEGTSSVENPQCGGLGGGADLKTILWRRHERPTATPYDDCNMGWKSGATADQSEFPVIADPCDPATDASCVGQTGDIVYDVGGAVPDVSEYLAAVNACMTAWDSTDFGSIGVIAVNAGRLVDSAGVPLNRLVAGGVPEFGDGASQMSSSGAYVVADTDFINSASGSNPPCLPDVIDDPADSITGHGLGHALSLGFPHAAGTLMAGGIGPFPLSLTSGGPGQTDTVCPGTLPSPTSQCGQLRLQALCHVPGTTLDSAGPPALLGGGAPPSAPVVDQRPCPLGDTSPAYVDLGLFGVVENTLANEATFFWETAGLFPVFEQDIEYGFAADLDENAATGGDPGTLIGVSMAGAEIAGQVKVDVQQIGEVKLITTTHTLWTYQSGPGQFAAVPALGSSARETRVSGSPGAPSESVPFTGLVTLDFDLVLLNPPASRALAAGGSKDLDVRAIARQDPRNPAGGEDVSPTTRLVLETPALATCSVSPSVVSAGDNVTVTASGITDVSEPYHVLLGPDEVAIGTTAANGDVSITFPVGSTTGIRVVSVGVDDPLNAVTADCGVQVLAAGTPGEASKLGDMVVTGYDTGTGELTALYAPACGSTDHSAHSGDLANVSSHAWDATHCGLGVNGTAVFAPGPGSRFFVVVGDDGAREGSYGTRSGGQERPEATTGAICDVPQDLTAPCP